MEIKNLKDLKKNAKYIQPNNLNKRPLGSIQIDVPESVRRKTVSPAFLSIDSSVMEGDLSEKFIDIIDLDVSFKLSTFLEFFIYNFLFFLMITLGFVVSQLADSRRINIGSARREIDPANRCCWTIDED